MSNRGAIPVDQIRRNDFGPLTPADAAAPAPVSVIVVDAVDQDRLDGTLAALAQQTHPGELLDVTVLDAGPGTLELPKVRPERCRISTAADGGFGPAVSAADGEVIVRVPAGIVVARDFIATLTRWQLTSPDVVSIAPARLAETGRPSADEIADHCASDRMDQLFPASDTVPHPALSRRLAASDQLRAADHLVFLAVEGVPFAFHRDRYQADADSYHGSDLAVGYRLAQAGAVFVPEPTARAWAPGHQPDGAAAAGGSPAPDRRQRAEVANLVPYPQTFRPAGGRTWAVPLVTAVVPAAGPYELVRTCVDRLLGGDESDLQVLLVGAWNTVDGGGPAAGELRLLAAEYRAEARVRLVTTEPDSAFPAPYLLRVPARLGVGPGTVRALVAAAERWQVGLVRVLPAGAVSAADPVELWATAARSRALRAGGPAEQLVAAVARTHGQRWETGSEYDVSDLSGLTTARLESPPAWRATSGTTGGGAAQSGTTVVVGGARSLAKATAFVTRRYARAAKRRITRR